MQGRLLILDAVATNRISLNALLNSACYEIEEQASLATALAAVRRERPDLILSAWSLPDGTAVDLRAALDEIDPDREIPIIALAQAAEAENRRAALSAGLADLMVQPVDDVMLHAKLRSLMRLRSSATGYDFPSDSQSGGLPNNLPGGSSVAAGFAEAKAGFVRADRIAVLASDINVATAWGDGLCARLNQPVTAHDLSQRHAVLAADPPPDAVIVAVAGATGDPALRLLADLRARSRTQHAALIAVPAADDPLSAAHALDLGADDVMTGPFDIAELALRTQALLRRKHLSDRLRSTVRDGLRAALVDPMTGLYNRRYAIPHLSHTIRRSAQTGKSFTVMMADLDHFKRINDSYGHIAGDTVLIEAAKRLRDALGAQDVIARIGGEEFLIVMRDTDTATAHETADRLRRAVDERPFVVSPSGLMEQVTVSIGVAVCPPEPKMSPGGMPEDPDESKIAAVMHEADLALYESKHAGRNTVTVVRAAA